MPFFICFNENVGDIFLKITKVVHFTSGFCLLCSNSVPTQIPIFVDCFLNQVIQSQYQNYSEEHSLVKRCLQVSCSLVGFLKLAYELLKITSEQFFYIYNTHNLCKKFSEI